MEWFKMQTIWGVSLERLSDAEAGRFIKAIYAYVRNGDEYNGNGKESLLVLQALEMLHGDIAKFRNIEAEALNRKKEISEKRRNAAMKRWKNSPDGCKSNANAMQNEHLHANADKCMQMQNLHANASQNKNKNKNENNGYVSNSSSSNSAPAHEGISSGFGSVYSEDELSAMQKQRMEDIPAIENLMRECGYAFSSADETIALELLNSGETAESIMNAIMIAKESNAVSWRYIKGILKKEKEGSYGQSYSNQSRRTGSGSGARKEAGSAPEEPKDDFDRYLESCHI